MEITQEVFRQGTTEDGFNYYESTFKELGYILEKSQKKVYKIYDKKIKLKEGDRICLDEDFWIVTWKCINLDSNIIEYSLSYE